MRVFIVLSVMFLLMCGCSQRHEEPKPETHKVQGKVVYSGGKNYTDGGVIEFRHETQIGATSIGLIEPNGTFSLQTSTAQHKVQGAMEGAYTVTIIPSAPDQNVQPIPIKKKYNIATGDNNLTVVIEE